MFESMWSSMTSSMQLAEECLKQGATEGKETDQSQPLEGLELFAQTIDSSMYRPIYSFSLSLVCFTCKDGVLWPVGQSLQDIKIRTFV